MRVERSLAAAVVLLLAVVGAAPAQDRDPATLLQEAMYREDVRGELETAIATYREIVESYTGHRDVAARALVELGDAYETLGRSEARSAYRRVLAEYPDQRGPARRARARLAALSGDGPGDASGARGLAMRRLMTIGSPVGVPGISPDGRRIAFVDWGPEPLGLDHPTLRGHTDVAVYDAREDRVRLVTDRPSQTELDTYPHDPIWSADGRWLAYAVWDTSWTHQRLHVVRPDGSEDRPILDSEQFVGVRPMAFSSNGDFVLTLLQGWDERYRIGLVSTRDGSLTVVKTLRSHRPFSLALSPDDRFIAYDYPAEEAGAEHDLFAVATDGSAEVPVAPHPSDDVTPFWTPDGERIVFVSDRSGERGLWSVGWTEGRPTGEPALIRPNIGPIRLQGVTRSGALYYGLSREESEVRMAEVDLSGDGSLADPSRVPETHLGTNFHPAWGPDGERIAHLSRRGREGASSHLVVKDLDSGEERDLALPFPVNGRLPGPAWSADGRSLWVSGGEIGAPSADSRARASYRVEVATGEVDREEHLRSVGGPQRLVDERQARTLRGLGLRLVWNRDRQLWQEGEESARPGETLLWVRNGVGRVDSVPTWEVEELSPMGHMHGWELSPDGRTVALGIASDPDRILADAIYVIPVAGGEARELLRLDNRDGGEREIMALRWSPDGERLLYAVDPAIETDPAHEVWTVGADGGSPRRLELSLDAEQLQGIRFHPDADRVAFTTRQERLELWLAEGLPWQETEAR